MCFHDYFLLHALTWVMCELSTFRHQHVQEEEQQLHEKRIQQLSVSQDSAQVSQEAYAFRASSTSLASLTSVTGSFRKRPYTAYEGRLAAAASGLQLSVAGSVRSSCADGDTGSADFSSTSPSDTPQAVCAHSHQAGPLCSDEWMSQSCSTGIKSCQPIQSGQILPSKRGGKLGPSPKSCQLSQSACV